MFHIVRLEFPHTTIVHPFRYSNTPKPEHTPCLQLNSCIIESIVSLITLRVVFFPQWYDIQVLSKEPSLCSHLYCNSEGKFLSGKEFCFGFWERPLTLAMMYFMLVQSGQVHHLKYFHCLLKIIHFPFANIHQFHVVQNNIFTWTPPRPFQEQLQVFPHYMFDLWLCGAVFVWNNFDDKYSDCTSVLILVHSPRVHFKDLIAARP